MIEMTEDEWWTKFQPMKNHLPNPTNEYSFETYGEESAYVYSIDPHFVWTEMDGDDGGIYIVEGRHFVNRIVYYVCRTPWLDGESYEICVADPTYECYECEEDLLTQEGYDEYSGLCERCYRAQGLGE